MIQNNIHLAAFELQSFQLREDLIHKCDEISPMLANSVQHYFRIQDSRENAISLGEYLPHVMCEMFGIPLGKEAKLGWLSIYIGTTILDDILDNDMSFNKSLYLTNCFLLSYGQNILQESISPEFQKQFKSSLYESAKFEFLDLQLNSNEKYSTFEIAKGKNKFVLLFGYVLASQNKSKAKKIITIANQFVDFIQYLDDLKDIESDIEFNNFNTLTHQSPLDLKSKNRSEIIASLVSSGRLKKIICFIQSKISGFNSLVEINFGKSKGLLFFENIEVHVNALAQILNSKTIFDKEVIDQIDFRITKIAQSS